MRSLSVMVVVIGVAGCGGSPKRVGGTEDKPWFVGNVLTPAVDGEPLKAPWPELGMPVAGAKLLGYGQDLGEQGSAVWEHAGAPDAVAASYRDAMTAKGYKECATEERNGGREIQMCSATCNDTTFENVTIFAGRNSATVVHAQITYASIPCSREEAL